MIEVMIVMAIVFLLAAIAVPIYSRVMLKAERTALASEATAVHEAMLAYYADHAKFPSAFFGSDRLNRATLAPLTTGGYLSPTVAQSFIRKQAGSQIWFYWSWWVGGKDQEFWLIMHPDYDPNELVYILHTQLLAGSKWHDGVYFWRPGLGYVKIDELKDQ
jgi:Tfp pilus assembly major pilin PilA